MHMITKLVTSSAVAVAVLVTAGVTSAAAATPQASAAAAVTTPMDANADHIVVHRGFTITNNSLYTLTLVNYSGEHRDDELPARGQVVRPGQQIGFQVAYLFLQDHEVTVRFDVTDPDGRRLPFLYMPVLDVDVLGMPSSRTVEIPWELRHTGWDQITLTDTINGAAASASRS